VHCFTECHSSPSAALGKEALYRVSDRRHSVKHLALGVEAVSGSGGCGPLLQRTNVRKTDRRHSAKHLALGVEAVSGSGGCGHFFNERTCERQCAPDHAPARHLSRPGANSISVQFRPAIWFMRLRSARFIIGPRICVTRIYLPCPVLHSRVRDGEGARGVDEGGFQEERLP
jgi:hypothetical protein